MIDSQPVPKQWSWNTELADFTKLTKKTELLEKFKLPDQKLSEPTEKRKKESCSLANPHL